MRSYVTPWLPRWFAAAVAAITVLLGSAAAAEGAAGVLYIRGGGDGHGVGMSQYGAYGYALHGKDYRFILAHYYQGTALGAADPSQTVRVLLADGAAAFSAATQAQGTLLSAPGAPKPKTQPTSKALAPTTTYHVLATANGSLTLYSQSGTEIGRFAAPLTITGPGPLNVSGLGSYRGSLELRPDGSGGVETINALDLEDYVRGVIGAEMPPSWASQALEAQAVAARTFAITVDVGGAGFDLYPDTRSQMYLGVAAETPSTDAAVAATRGQIVTYRGAPVMTYFFSSSGGATENIENVWPGASSEPWLRGVPDPYDGAGGNPDYRWQHELSVSGAAAKLGGLVKGTLIGIRVTRHGFSPRIVTAQVVGSKGAASVTGGALQQLFGLPSTYASFTTIRTAAGVAVPVSHAASSSPRAPALARAVTALMTAVGELVADAVPALQGSVFPARKGDPLAIQKAVRGGWRTIADTRLRAGGSYDVALPGAGSYRVVYAGLRGPAVSVR